MTVYSNSILGRLCCLKNASAVAGVNAEGTAVDLECGTYIRLSLKIDAAARSIEGVSFRSNGCGYMLAAADVLGDALRGRELTELHGFNDDTFVADITSEIGPVPVDRQRCVTACIDAARQAFADFRVRQIAEFAGEKALICTCFGVSEETLEAAVYRQGLSTVEAVGVKTRAGTGCGSCRMLIQEIIDSRPAA